MHYLQLWLALVAGVLLAARGIEETIELYNDIRPINRTESLSKISALPIVYYKFLYDSVPDRLQLGAVGPQVQQLFPESVEVLPSATFSNSSSLGGRPTTFAVTNFPIIDKNILFMHGLAALQELVARYDVLLTQINSLDERDQVLFNKILSLQAVLNQSISRQLQTRLEAARLESSIAAEKLQQEERRAAEEQSRLQARLTEERALLEYEEQLARARLLQQEEMAKAGILAQLQLERELAEKKEAMQQATTAKLQQLRREQNDNLESKKLEFEKEKIRTEIEARAAVERQKETIQLEKLKLQAQLDTQRMVEGIRNVSLQITNIFRDLLSHPRQLATLGGLFLALIAAYYLIKELASLIRQFIQKRLGQPTLVRETSWHFFGSLSAWWLSSVDQATAMQNLTREFEDIILRPEDKQRILQLALATRNTRLANSNSNKKQSSKGGNETGAAPYRHVLLHGPPGTGKTLIARRLAKVSHMDYAILSGGDVAPLGEDAVNQLHALFRWANRSPRGLLVFIDEAEAFLSSRTSNNNSSGGDGGNVGESAQHLRNALNALLYQTGAPSRNFMLVLATNRPQDLDAAVLDRIDVSLQISLPKTEQRQALLRLYLDQHVLTIVNESKQHNKSRWVLFGRKLKEYAIDPDCLSTDAMQYMSEMTRGFSGREISKLFISAQYELYLSMDRKLTWMALQRVVQTKAEEHQMKQLKFKLPPTIAQQNSSKNDAENELHFAQIYGTGPEQGGEEDQFIATSPLSTSPTNFIAPAFEKPTVSRGRSMGRRSSVSNANNNADRGGVMSASGVSGVTSSRTRGGMR